ncbi:MAG: hypothetical protein ACI4XM_04490 [Candidatus Coprovivens sp.]
MKKKIIILSSLLLLISGCKEKEIECEEQKEETLIKYNNTKITEKDALEETKEYIFPVIFEKVIGDILTEEMKDKLEDGNNYAEETIEELKTYYEDELEKAIISYTSYKTIEEYKRSILISYLQEEYFKEYISNKEKIDYNEITDDNLTNYYKKYYVESINDLLKKYNVTFENKDYKKMYEKYIEEKETYYNNN